MCGIFASFNNFLSDKQIDFILDDLGNRGPDACGVYKNKKLNFTLLHTRLKIVDLDDRSNQPLIIRKRYVCIYNGEIYNLEKLRNQLIKKGFTFRTLGDTEILINSYICWGKNFLDYVDGMFSFVIFDLVANDVIFARDRFGQKPLYYTFYKNQLFISSKISLILKLNILDNKLNSEVLNTFLINGFVKFPNTIIKDIFKLTPGEMIYYNISTKKFFKRKQKIKNFKNFVPLVSEDDYLNFFEKKLQNAISLMHPKEVPSAYLLSGGLDSSILTALASKQNLKINTFTIIQKNSTFNEASYANYISKHFNTNHFEVEINETNPIDYLDKIYDEPIIDSSLIPSTIIFENLPSDIKVTIGGDGADELFGGYNHYPRICRLEENYKKIKLLLNLSSEEFLIKMFKNNSKASKWIKAFYDIDKGYCPSIQNYLTDWQCKEIIIDKSYNYIDEHILYSRENILQKDIEGYLANDILVKLDYSSMNSSKEARSPFLSDEIYKFAKYICPTDLKFNTNERKIILKKLGKKILPRYFEFDRKQGFQIDVKKIVYSNSFKEIFNQIVEEKDTFFNSNFLKKLYNSNPKINSEFIFNFCCFQRWLLNHKITL